MAAGHPNQLTQALRRLLGWCEARAFGAVGALSVRSDLVYRLDARIASRRRHRDDQRLRQASESPRSLARAEQKVFSQNGEDGVIREVFDRIGTRTRTCIEIGASDGQENCTRALVEQGWRALWIEADAEVAARAATVAPDRVTVIDQPAHRDSVASMLRGTDVTDPDLLVVDIDGDDLGVLCSALEAVHPPLVVVEYNAAFTPTAIWSSDPNRVGGWEGTCISGVTLAALDSAARARGYRLVHCDTRGVNAFFVRRELADLFDRAGDLRHHHRVTGFSLHPFGHPRTAAGLVPMPQLTTPDSVGIEIRSVTTQRRVAPGGLVDARVTIHNSTAETLSSGGPNGVYVSARWLDEAASLPPATIRAPWPRPIPAGTSTEVRLVLRAPQDAGEAVLRATAVVEAVTWRELQRGPFAFADAPVTIE